MTNPSPRAMIFSASIFAFFLLTAGAQCKAQTTGNLDQALNALSSQEIKRLLGNNLVKRPALSDNDPKDGSKTEDNPTNEPTTGDATGGAPPQAPLTQLGDRFESRDRNAPRRDNLQAIKIVKHVNGLFSGFDQGAGFGFGIELTTADKIPGVEFRAKAIISTRFYRRLEAEAYIPKVIDEQTHANVWFTYLRRTRDNFFGIGPRTPKEPETNYASEYRTYNASLFRDFTKDLQAGVYFSLGNIDAYRGKDDNDVPIDVLYSNNPNIQPVTRWLPGLHTNAKIVSYGAFTEYNGRTNERGLTKGAYFYGRISSLDGLKNDFFSDFGWMEFSLDGRAYLPLGSDFTSVALRINAEFLDPKGGSQIPFYVLPWYGGRSHGRGFSNYRFRGNNLLLFSIEPRRTVWKQSDTKGLDVFVFGDGGQVWGDSRSTTDPQVLANEKFSSKNWRYGIGGGAQYRLNKDFAVRLDFGHSNERNMVYISLSRGF